MSVELAVEQDRIGQMLVSAGLITENQLKDAAAVQSETGDRLINILIAQGAMDSKRFVAFLAEPGKSHAIDVGNVDIPAAVIELVPRNFALLHHVVPVERDGSKLTVASESALDRAVIEALEEHTGLSVKSLICPRDDVRTSLARHYENPGSGHEDLAGTIEGPLKLTMAVSMLRHIDSLPALPGTVHRVREVIYGEDGSAADVAEAISQDPAIAARVLRVANSAAYGFTHQVDNVQLAVSLLGLMETYSIVISSAVVNLFDQSRSFDYKQFWLESLVCARVARALSRLVENKNHAGMFSAGLLHDLGRVAILQIAPKQYENISSSLKGPALIEAEEQQCGLNHTEAGYQLAQHWGLPEELSNCIRFHHAPDKAPEASRTMTAIVNVAEMIAHADRDEGAPDYNFGACTAALEILDLTEKEVRDLAESVPRPEPGDSLWS